MSAPIPTPAEVAPQVVESQELAAPAATPQAPVPTPPATPVEPPATEETLTPEQLRAALTAARQENAGYRVKLRDAAPILTAHQEAEEAAKTQAQRDSDRIAQLEVDLAASRHEATISSIAAAYGIAAEDTDLLGSGTREEIEARAKRLASMRTPTPPPEGPPTNRPIESLKPGASTATPPVADNSYPDGWSQRARTQN